MFFSFQIYRLVLQGQIDKVRSLLSHNTAAQMEPFRCMDEVLRRMPVSHVSWSEACGRFHLISLNMLIALHK